MAKTGKELISIGTSNKSGGINEKKRLLRLKNRYFKYHFKTFFNRPKIQHIQV